MTVLYRVNALKIYLIDIQIFEKWHFDDFCKATKNDI
jgi:hypothetical protein